MQNVCLGNWFYVCVCVCLLRRVGAESAAVDV